MTVNGYPVSELFCLLLNHNNGYRFSIIVFSVNVTFSMHCAVVVLVVGLYSI